MVDTFARRHWSDFERLAFEFTTDCFGVTPTKLFRTQEQMDGGFDGVLVHELGKLGAAVVSHETLMEAKLRTSPDAIGLRAFAATMIVAFNGRTQCLVVVTNREFSPQALAAARDFEWKSRLQVHLASRRTLSAWIRPRRTLLAAHYAVELLDDLTLPTAAADTYEEVVIPSNVLSAAPEARIGFGRLASGSVSRGRLAMERAALPANDLIIGSARRALVAGLATVLDGSSGCLLVTGDVGVGKSHVIRAALAAVRTDRRCTGIIDLGQVSTSRNLFLALLAAMSGVEVSEAVREFTDTEVRGVFSNGGGTVVPVGMRDAVIRVLKGAERSERRSAELDQVPLLGYLTVIAASLEKPSCIVLNNADHAPAEVLEFVHAVISHLVLHKISVIIEFAAAGSVPLVDRTEWMAHQRLFERHATLGTFSVQRFEIDDGI